MTINRIGNINEIMQSLSLKRPVFHSEADFQHAFAWEIQNRFPEAKIRLEQKFNANGGKYVDVVVAIEDLKLAIELKYKTRKASIEVGGERFELTDQSAQDIGRFDFYNDIRRLEMITEVYAGWHGLSIFLTNDSSYWCKLQNPEVGYADFSMEEGRSVKGNLCWGHRAGPGTRKGRDFTHELCGEHLITWHDYSQIPTKRYDKLRYVAVLVQS